MFMSRYATNRGLGGPESRSGRFAAGKHIWLLSGFDPLGCEPVAKTLNRVLDGGDMYDVICTRVWRSMESVIGIVIG
jgi:hypothetical protein